MTKRCWLLCCGPWLACGAGLQGQDLHRLSVGTRGAISASSYNDPFVQVEAFANWELPGHRPWRLESASGWYVQSRLDFAAGWLRGRSEDGLIASLGPAFSFGKLKFPLSVEIGCSPTVLSRYRFGETDLGFPFQFTSHVGAMVELGARVSVSYRLQHMSDAGISRHNPGLDLHSIGLSYRF